ncbi:hypothetical protein P1P91_01935 [Halomonas piscis]|uniref:Adhesin n=1 Tax=Halomonas piscis TaxID=3031727 RepID=A0ABY9Z0C0_9GAMM|nr:hypothetical protein [Halomonas piscis]WNK20471.1 hypothetical protein P1P91_01935 [Halomonas piscis]
MANTNTDALKKSVTATAGILLIAGFIQTAAAQDPAMRNSTVLSSQALSGVSGVSTTNMAAGDGNLQSNAGTLVISNIASSANKLQQQSRIEERLIDQQNITEIKGAAFQQSEGWLSINQAAGQGNAQSNSFGVAMGISASNLSDTTLQGVQADRQGLAGTDERSRQSSSRVEVDSTAFEGARGVIQVNQSAGTGNATSNSFRMNMALKP